MNIKPFWAKPIIYTSNKLLNLIWSMYFAFALYLQIHLISDKCCRITKILPLFPNLMQSAVPVSILTSCQIDYQRLADSHDYDFSRQDPLNLQEVLVLEDGEILKSCKFESRARTSNIFMIWLTFHFFFIPKKLFWRHLLQ